MIAPALAKARRLLSALSDLAVEEYQLVLAEEWADVARVQDRFAAVQGGWMAQAEPGELPAEARSVLALRERTQDLLEIKRRQAREGLEVLQGALGRLKVVSPAYAAARHSSSSGRLNVAA